MKAAVSKAVHLRECPFRELLLHLEAFHKEGNHFGVQTTVSLLVMDKCLIPGRSSSIPRYRDLKLELGSEPNPLVRPKPNPLVRDLLGGKKIDDKTLQVHGKSDHFTSAF